jgi:hypothetical protein
MIFATILLILIVPIEAAAQEATQPGTIVFSQNKCPLENFPQLDALGDSIFSPVLDEFVDEGKLLGWGILTHNWGDEWNWNIYYTIESHEAFLEFWSEYVDRLNQRHPGWSERIAPLCTEHRDNIYSVRVAHPR